MKSIFTYSFFFISIAIFSQQEDAWLFFKDKPNSATFIANPIAILSQRAIDRRNLLQISIDETDAPIHENYLSSIKNTLGIIILGKSKWLNAVHVRATKVVLDATFQNNSFIRKIEFANKNFASLQQKSSKKTVSAHQQKFQNSTTNFVYGSTSDQVTILKGEFLHQQGYTGQDQIIAVIDAGFPNVNTLAAFQRIRDNNQILGGYNFADRNSNFYTRHNHGTNVLSTIAGYIENQFVGTAPDAKFYLFISEIDESETVLEETLWVEAAERSDSLGVDVINTSLGYTTFDNPNHDYNYNDMNGSTTFISRGAQIAASRGILVVNAAGNEGNSSWKYISAPADANDVITVGAIDKNKNIASFSSFGPTSDLRVKPEVLSIGVNSAVINHVSGAINSSNGTSFSSPILAGLIACLNQRKVQILKENPTLNGKDFNQRLKDLVIQSADRFYNPLSQYGYGIPNFEIAYNELSGLLSVVNIDLEQLKITPNPVINSFKIQNMENSSATYSLEIFNILGKKVFEKNIINTENIDISNFKKGIYFVKILSDRSSRTIKILKE